MATITELSNSKKNSGGRSESGSPTGSVEEENKGASAKGRKGSKMVRTSIARDEYTAFGELVGTKVRGLHRHLRSYVKQEIINSLDSAELAASFHEEEIRRASAVVPMSSAASSGSYERQRPFERELETIYVRQVPSTQPAYNYSQSADSAQGTFNGLTYSVPPSSPQSFFPPPVQVSYNGLTCYAPQPLPALVVPYVPNQSVPRSQMGNGPSPSYNNPMPTGNFGYSTQVYSNSGPAHVNPPPSPGPVFRPPCPLNIELPNVNVIPPTILNSLDILRRNQSGTSD